MIGENHRAWGFESMAAHSRPRRAGKLRSLPVSRLERGSLQPRHAIDGIALKKLAESILSEGIIQPIFVRKSGHGKFEIVAGERRWHAAKMAGLKSVPTVVGEVSDESALAIALIENLHREDLNPIDQALAIQRLVDEFFLTHQEVADTIGKSRTAVTNLLRLLELPDEVQCMVADGTIDMGHARALLALPCDQRLAAADKVASECLSVREVERMVRQSASRRREPVSPERGQMQESNALLDRELDESFNGKARIHECRGGAWQLNVDFTDLDELHSLLVAIDELVRDRRRRWLHLAHPRN